MLEDSSQSKSVENDHVKQPNVDDSCPDWAVSTIDQLRQVEIILGNVPKAIEWQSSLLKDVNKKIFVEREGPITEAHSELLFRKIARGLNQEGFSTTDICMFINARIGYVGGPMYCDETEVIDSLTK